MILPKTDFATATAMAEPRFDYTKSKWASGGDPARWSQELEDYGLEVRALLAQVPASSPSSIPIGTAEITVGFIREWLAWHDRQRAEREASFRQWQIFWSRWTALAATATALVAAIGWIVTLALRK